MECKEIFAKLSEYLDRELPDNLCEEMDAHIHDCPPCVEFVRSLEKTVEMCKQITANEGPSPLPDEVMGQLRQQFEKLKRA
jgi:RNA polymerase sigma-70 factor (ECF subfamily)